MAETTRQKIRRLIKERGFKMIFVAEQVGITPVHLSRVLRDTEPATLTKELKDKLFSFLGK